jgi:hypothetical protein
MRRTLPDEGSREHGDVQTPPALAAAVVRRLAARGVRPARILEPSCGTGAFLGAARATFGETPRLVGIELRERYRSALEPLAGPRTTIRFGDAAELDLAALLRDAGDGYALVVGNLPWITTDALARLGAPGPRRGNPKALRGLDALTGASSFDLAEYLALRIVDALAVAASHATFAMLLKESVARRLLRELRRRAVPIANASVARIDARRAFGVATDAALLEIDFAPEGTTLERVAVSPALDVAPAETWFVGDTIVAGDPALASGAGSRLVWRQGLKHDAAAVFEVARRDDRFVNGLGECVDVEDETIFQFVRARDLARGEAHDGHSHVLVPYASLRGSEAELARRAPRLHAYLARHAAIVDARRSSVYVRAPRFALFGIGPYAFARHKVAISGLHSEPRFVVLSGERPIQLADTAYALAFETREDAKLIAALLSSEPAVRALRSGIFAGKRPVTKRLLAQLDLAALARDPAVIGVVIAALEAGGERAPAEAVARRLRELVTDERPKLHSGAA